MVRTKKQKEKKEKIQRPKQEKKKSELITEPEPDIMDLLKPLKNINIDKGYLIIASIILVAIIIISLGIWYSNASKTFFYNGIKFEKTQEGKITFYTAIIPVVNSDNEVTSFLPIDFRSDPRKIKDIMLEIPGLIRFNLANITYVSYDDLKVCEDNGLAALNFGVFLSRMGIKKEGALANRTTALNANTPYVTCETNPKNTVILVKEGNETKIKQTNTNCYEITFKNCEILRVMERFELAILEQYMSQFA